MRGREFWCILEGLILLNVRSFSLIFLRKLAQGGSEHSFGIHVARMAGMPKSVIDRANIVLKKLEKEHEMELTPAGDEGVEQMKMNGKKNLMRDDEMQLSFFKLDDPVLEQIKADILKTDINNLTPVEALLKLNEIKKLVGG